MPYPKYKRKRNYTRKSGLTNRKDAIKLIDQRINQNSEQKHYDTTYGSAVSSTGITIQMTGVAQGDGDNQRIGDSIQFSELSFRMLFENIDNYNVLRMLVVQWHPNDAVDPCEVTKVLNSASYLSNLNWHRRSDYRVLYDNMFKVDSDDPVAIKKVVIKNKVRKVLYNEGTPTGHNQIFLIIISDSTTINHPQVNYHRRLTYYDR